MTHYGQIIRTILTNQADITTLIPADNIQPVILEQTVTRPALAYTYEIKPVYNMPNYDVCESVMFMLYIFHNHPDDLDVLCQTIRRNIDYNSTPITVNDRMVYDVTFDSQNQIGFDKELDTYFTIQTYKTIISAWQP